MPFTPYHLGPGLLLKAALPRHVSLVAYSAAQVAIDLEPAWYLFVVRESPLHRAVHGLGAAALVGLAAGAAVAAAGRLALSRGAPVLAPWARGEIAPSVAIASGVVGGILHVLLDAIFHQDVLPFAPFSAANPLEGLVSRDAVELACVAAGIVGGIGLLLRARPASPHDVDTRDAER